VRTFACAAVIVLTGLGSAWAQNVEFLQVSEPAGIVTQQTFPALSNDVSTVTAPYTTGGYRFCYWTINGTRYNDLLGRAANPVNLLASGPLAAVAHYLPATQDSNGSGLSDAFKLEYFGTLNITSNSIPVADGFTVGQKLQYGWNPAAYNQLEPGGISRRRMGGLLVVVPGYVGPRDHLGGISRRRSTSTTVILNNAYASLNEVSSPAGILGSSRVLLKGSTVNLSTAPDSSYGYRFTGWLVNGVRVDQPTQKQPIPFTVTGNTTVVARYILESADTLGVGIADWVEWFNFNSTGYTLDSDPLGDGITLGMKIFRGYPLASSNELVTGGLSRRRSATATVILDTNHYVRLEQLSDPAGIVTRTSQVVAKDSAVNLSVAPDSGYGYRFTGWLTNGVRVDLPTQKQPIPITVAQDTTVVARYILEAADTLGVGIPDWVEWFNFNRIGYTLDSDPLGEGINVGVKVFRGYPLAVYNQLGLGGVSRRRSVSLPVNYFRVPPPGATTDSAGQVGTASVRLMGFVNPNSLPTSVYFEYGLTEQYGESSLQLSVGSGTNVVPFHCSLSGLAPATIYHFRIVSTSKSGVSYGTDQTFTTDMRPLAIQGISQNSGLLTLTWNARLGNVYQLQSCTNLLSAIWVDWGAPFTATNASAAVSDFIGAAPQGFYRVILPQ
jgi:hypothetical protein